MFNYVHQYSENLAESFSGMVLTHYPCPADRTAQSMAPIILIAATLIEPY